MTLSALTSKTNRDFCAFSAAAWSKGGNYGGKPTERDREMAGIIRARDRGSGPDCC